MPLRGDLIIFAELLNQIYPVGAVIHSTTLSTEIDVINQFGGTHWIQHTEYFLRGGDTVTPGQAQSDGGSDDAIIPYHNHTAGNQSQSHTHSITGGSHTHGIRLEYGYPGTASCPPGGNYGQVTNNTGYPYYNNNTMIQYTTHSHSCGGISANHTHTINYTGESTVGANKPAYKSVYIWERVS